tara:strand:- start:1125 stop:1568 length:444 start_codon:yes stop_codon:yes gene_type:complete
MDLLNKFLKLADHNRGAVIALIITICLNTWLFGMASRTGSLIHENRQVTRVEMEGEIGIAQAELNARIESFNAKVAAAVSDLDEQDRIKAEIVEIVGGLATTIAGGGFEPTQIVATILGISGVLGLGGAVVDNRRKDKIIKNGHGTK